MTKETISVAKCCVFKPEARAVFRFLSLHHRSDPEDFLLHGGPLSRAPLSASDCGTHRSEFHRERPPTGFPDGTIDGQCRLGARIKRSANTRGTRVGRRAASMRVAGNRSVGSELGWCGSPPRLAAFASDSAAEARFCPYGLRGSENCTSAAFALHAPRGFRY